MRTGLIAATLLATRSNGRTPDWLLQSDPRLYELVRQVIPARKMPGNVFVGGTRGQTR